MADEQIIKPRVTCSISSEIDSLDYMAVLNDYPRINFSYHPDGPGVVRALSTTMLAQRDVIRASIEASRVTPSVTFSLSTGDNTWDFSGFPASADAGIVPGSLNRPASVVHAAAVLSGLRLSIYSLPTSFITEQAALLGGSLTERLLAITESIEKEGNKRLAESSHPLAAGLKKIAELNRAPMQAWRTLLTNSADTIGYDSIKDLDTASQMSRSINQFLYSRLIAVRMDFFQVIQSILGAFYLYYAPGTGTDPGLLCSAPKMLENAEEIPLDGKGLRFSDGLPGNIKPGGIQIVGLPVMPNFSEDSPFKWGATNLAAQGAVVYPEDAEGMLAEVGSPQWLPVLLLPSLEKMETGTFFAKAADRFKKILKDQDADTRRALEDDLKKIAPVINDYAKHAWQEMDGAGSSATLTMLLTLDPRLLPGRAVNFTLASGGAIKGIVRSLQHAVDGKERGVTETRVALSYLQPNA